MKMKKISAVLLSAILTFNISASTFANTDVTIYTDTVQNTYTGKPHVTETIANLNFTDIGDYWAAEAIVKAGAFNMIKGYNNLYDPYKNLTNQEALAFILRLMGLEEQAQAAGVMLANEVSSPDALSIWSRGYLYTAWQQGLITEQEYREGSQLDQSALGEGQFARGEYVSRERIVDWLVKAVNMMGAGLVPNEQQSIYNYSDWLDVNLAYINNIEIALDNGIIRGSGTAINPKDYMTRGELAQVLSNLDNIYYSMNGFTKKTGTVRGIQDSQVTQTGSASLDRDIYIRADDGTVDILKYSIGVSTSPTDDILDAVVYNGTSVTGLGSLREGSQIEYIVNDANKIVEFVSVKATALETSYANGKILSVDFDNNFIQIQDLNDKVYSYYMNDGLIGYDTYGEFIYIDEKRRRVDEVPYGSMVQLLLRNNGVSYIKFVGEASLLSEVQGVVIENNPDYGYLVIRDTNGDEIVKNYFADSVEVEKQPYYTEADDVGYLDQLFDNFDYDIRDSDISKIEVGDIVYLRSDADNPTYISQLSAKTNYTVKYGKITELSDSETYVTISVEAEDGQISIYEISKTNVPVSKGGSPVTTYDILAGDNVQLLVNEAIISPGYVTEVVKEVYIEDIGHKIGDILKGQIGSLNPIQGTLALQNSYTLRTDGWGNYQQIRQLSYDNNKVEYYYNGEKVTLDYVQNNLTNFGGDVYVALEQGFGGDVISKLTFRNERDQEKDPDLIIAIEGGNVTTASGETLQVDSGTIIRKNGNLVNVGAISMNDYAYIILNGDNKAAVLDIDSPSVSVMPTIGRVRVGSIVENKSFTSTSISVLQGTEWQYSPIQRTFTIDEQTLFMREEGIELITSFIGYSDDTSIDKSFTIVYEGDKVTHLIENSYPQNVVSGTIYSPGTEIVGVKDAKYLDDDNIWQTLSVINPTMDIVIGAASNTLVFKDNKVVSLNSLEANDQIMVYTMELPEDPTSGMQIDGIIIMVTN